MKLILFLVIGGVAVTRHCHSYLTQMADTIIAKGVDPDRGYQDAVLYLGIEKAYELSEDKKYLDWYKGQIEGPVVQEDGTIKDWNYTRWILDEYRMGHNYLYLYYQTGDDKYKSAADIVRHMLDSYPRTPSGGFCLTQNQGISNSFQTKCGWMGFTWQTLTTPGGRISWDDILLQYKLIDTHTRNETSDLHVHGWAETDKAPWADPTTGRAPNVWGRALGWYFMSLVEVLQFFPTYHPGRDQLLGYFESLAWALKRTRDPTSGNWRQVMNEPYPGREGNFIESSGSAMFTWGLLKGVDLGYLNRDDFIETAKDSYLSLVDNFVTEAENGALVLSGTVAECGLLNSNVTFEYYTSRPTLLNGQNGVGPFMLAAYEWEAWAKDASFPA
ncbi:glycosyl hydrolase [Ilyonectria sp. MPI-CAGE-AT-0026]|nr:glycosyl hydrolase [Ilyonectria sp. MPI-CAGE-AT-0026]